MSAFREELLKCLVHVTATSRDCHLRGSMGAKRLNGKRKARAAAAEDEAFEEEEEELSSPLPSDEDGDDEPATGFERGARRLDAVRARQEEEARAEQAELQVQDQEPYELPSGEELEQEAAGAPNLAAVRRRIQDVARVLAHFKQLRQLGRSRQDYMDRLKADLATYYGCVSAAALTTFSSSTR